MTLRAVDVASNAARDIDGIARTSRHNFGDDAARRYMALISAGIRTLADDPAQRTAKTHKDVLGGAHVYHIRHVRQSSSPKIKSPRHLIVYTYDDEFLRVLRILHDAMDLPQRLSIR